MARFSDSLSPEVTGLSGHTRYGAVRVREYGLWPGYRFPMHTHCRPGLVVGVTGRFSAEMDGLPYHVEEGQVLVLPRGEVHCESAGVLGATCVLLEPDGRGPWPGSAARPRVLRMTDGERQWMGRVLHVLGEDSPPEARGAGLPRSLLARLGDWRDSLPQWLSRAWLAANEAPEHWRVSTLARAAGVRAATLSRAFRRVFGTTPSRVLQANRAERAVRMLTETTMPIAAVALDAGYCDQSHLTRAVVARFGVTPSRLRRGVSSPD